MVQFVFTPWRDRAELLRVRGQFYPSATITSASTTAYAPSDLAAIQKAVARVFMWVHRGHCPHVVESTAMLMSAVVLDRKLHHHHHHHHHHHRHGDIDSTNTETDEGGEEEEEDGEDDDDDDDDDDAASDYGVRAAYLTAFTRFVTGLLDGHQDKARKLSMYGVAKTVGLPTGFVELRHQGTHEAMPGLAQLRPAAGRALRWIWEYYWRNLPDHDGDGDGEEEGQEGGPQEGRPEDGTAAAAAGGGGGGGGGILREGEGGAGFLAAAASAVGVGTTSVEAGSPTAGGAAAAAAAAATSGIRERMCKRALTAYLQRQQQQQQQQHHQDDAGGAAAREALMRQLGQWDDLLVVRVLSDMGQSARDGGMLARTVRLSREILGRDGDADVVPGDVEGMRGELARARRELEGAREGGGKRKRAVGDDDGPGWKRWEGFWAPRPIGIS